jgi:hypothetical protein
MKVILSRKGSDSGSKSGRMASPILPCGCLCSVAIPYERGVRYSDIRFGKRTLWDVCHELNPGWKDGLAHLDPDLRFESLARNAPRTGWRPAFGQSGFSERHLYNQGVGEKGDLFIFFGWFRRTKTEGGKVRFDPKDKHGRHIIYGWLEIGEVFPVDGRQLPDRLRFLSVHPHVRFPKIVGHPNRVYVASDPGLKAGLFGIQSDDLVLTRPGSDVRSQWQLPEGAFDSVFRQTRLSRTGLSYHRDPDRWEEKDGRIGLRAVSRGQEFVVDGQEHPSLYQHFATLIKSTSKASTTCPHDF